MSNGNRFNPPHESDGKSIALPLLDVCRTSMFVRCSSFALASVIDEKQNYMFGVLMLVFFKVDVGIEF